MRAIILMFDSLNRHMLSPYADTIVEAPNFVRLAAKSVTFENFYAGSMPCMPARREMHTGRYNFLHRSWGPLEPFDDSMPEMLGKAGVHTHLASDHPHYWEDGGATYHPRYTTWEFFRGQEGDPWKGVVAQSADDGGASDWRSGMKRQDVINRSYMPTEAEHSQTRTVDAGLHFIDTNQAADQWMLQIELFDPHEPFFTHPAFKAMYPHNYDGPGFDWPGYQKVTEPQSQVDHARYEYAALVSMCDKSLGRVLDAMDQYDMWKDTLLLVNTDHGFLLGEHGWWAKSVQPWFNELVHLPMFLWDPRTAGRDTRRGALAQTIDIAPTMLRYFGLEPTADMQGRDLAVVLEDDTQVREAALFGIHGGHVNATDGRYVYMRAAADASNAPLEDYTLMPTHMRSRFAVPDLSDWQPADPFSFTKGLRTMKMPATSFMNSWAHGTLLFDLKTDPEQNTPLTDDDTELRMLQLLAELMHASDAPRSQFERLGIPFHSVPGKEHLQVRRQAARSTAALEPLPPLGEFPDDGAALNTPILELMQDPRYRDSLERHLPQLVSTELINIPAQLTLHQLAKVSPIPVTLLVQLAEELATVPTA
ncbi:sulfatase [Arthrobacter sp. AZCC_0090]|uniref:sulfatase n=1 Tax=Arthrobacter sp. AZCC_0090 TaxID=2735881 RepID=UPI001618A06F|nr:sulfatase [Arthrobacter sp. AZCC_0090]MBB6402821.1 arylsulfatase A-like enzyme [Arthrobacter sp. AZCC_0090]